MGGLAEEQRAARGRPLEPEHEPDERRLAAAVGAGDRDELAPLDGEVDVREHRPAAVRRRRRRRGARRLAAPERLAQGGEVRAHDREVVLAAGDLLLGQALDRIRAPRSCAPVSRATVSASFGETSVSKKIVVAPARLTSPTTCSRLPGRRLGLGRESGDRDLLQPVAVGEVAERGVAGDDLTTLAVGEAALELAVEPADPATRGRAPVARGLAPCRSSRRSRRSGPGRARRADPSASGSARRSSESCLKLRSTRGVLDRGLEAAAQVEDDVGRSGSARRRAPRARGRAARRPGASGS